MVCVYAFNIYIVYMHTCIWLSHSFFCVRLLALPSSRPLSLPFILTYSGMVDVCVCLYLRYDGNGSLKMAYVSRSLFLPFALVLSHTHTASFSLIYSLSPSLSFASVQCRLHISLYIPRVRTVCYPLTLSHMQFVWSDTNVSVTKYTHTQTNNQMKSCCWFFCIFKCADFAEKKRMKKRTLHTKAYDFFLLGQWYIFIFNIASHPNINESVLVCVYVYMCNTFSILYSLRPRILFSIRFDFIFYIFLLLLLLLLPNNTQIRTQLHIK